MDSPWPRGRYGDTEIQGSVKRWLVFTPDYEKYAFNGIDPAEYGADVIEVEAETKRDAIALGVKAMLADWHFKYCREQRSDSASPYTGVRAHEADEFYTEIDNPELEPA